MAIQQLQSPNIFFNLGFSPSPSFVSIWFEASNFQTNRYGSKWDQRLKLLDACWKFIEMKKTIFIWSYGQLVCSTDRCEGKIIHICMKKIQFHLVFWSGRLAPPNQGFNSCRKPQNDNTDYDSKRIFWNFIFFFFANTHTQSSQCSSLTLTSLVLRVFTMTHPGPTFHKGLFQQGFRHLQCIAHPQVMGFLHGTVPWTQHPAPVKISISTSEWRASASDTTLITGQVLDALQSKRLYIYI